MPNYLQINIPESCHENWGNMQPNAQGRHCFSCQKNVVDFTNMTDAELINFFAKNKGNTCGRFNSDQLQRDILIPKKKINWMKYFFQFALPAFLLSIKTSAKSASSFVTRTEMYPVKTIIPGDTIGKIRVEERTISGKIIDEKGNPIPYASIVIKGTRIGVAATDSGTFKLPYPNSTKNSTVVIAALNYHSKEVTWKDLQNKTPIILTASQGGELGLFVVVAGGVSASRRKKKKQVVIQTDTVAIWSTKIYPNPISSSGTLNINWTNAEAGKYSIQITNLQGQIVQVEKLELSKKQSASSFNLKNIISGSYSVAITNTKTGKHFSNQLIVQ